jgi:hypothetical protein
MYAAIDGAWGVVAAAKAMAEPTIKHLNVTAEVPRS